MHNPTRNILAGLLVMGTLVTSLHSQAPATGDPFVKDAAAANTKKDEPWKNLFTVLEVYALSQEDAVGVLETERGGAARYRRVLELSKGGKARLETLTAISGKSGQRVVAESVDEVRYPTEFTAPASKESHAGPTAWEVRNAGDVFEFESVLSPDGQVCSMNIVPQRVSLKEFLDIRGAATDDEVVSQPQFITQKLTTGVTLRVNEAFYLGTMTPPTGATANAKDQAAPEIWLAFLRVSLSGPTAEEFKPASKPKAATSLTLEYSWYSLDRTQARDLLAATSTLNAPWDNLQALLKEKKARLEHATTINTTSGQRAITEEIDEVRYATEYVAETIRPTSIETTIRSDKAAAGGKPDAAATAERTTVMRQEATGARQSGYARVFETRNAGVTIEVEPVIGPDGVTIDLNQALQKTTHLGTLQATGAAVRYAAQPLFEARKSTCSQSLLLGRHMLVGTMNPPSANGVNGRRDTGRTWLVFVRALNEP
jgi:hypothetical protein